MTEYLTEQEQIQQLKTWIKTYGMTIILGIIVAIVLSRGWLYWQNYQNKIRYHASAVFDEMRILRVQNDMSGAVVQAHKLMTHYPKTPYAAIASLLLAREAVLQKNYPEAITHLKWVQTHQKDTALKAIATIRIARLLLAEHKPDDALTTLDTCTNKQFSGMVDEVRGDAYLNQNKIAEARVAYQRALQEIPNADILRPLLQMKIDNLNQP